MMKKILFVIICLILLIFTFAACDKDNNPFISQLAAPSNVRFDGAILNWDAVTDADSYKITIFTTTSSYTITQDATIYPVPISSAGNYKAIVKASRKNGSFKDSEASEEVIYHMGVGTEMDPVIIYSAEELAKIGIGATITTVNNEKVTKANYYILSKDIDLAGIEWAPIGTGDNRFQGHFDGQGYTISNYKITKASGSYYGLFKGILNGSVKNLNVSNYTININCDGKYRIGGLAGYISNSTIENCTSNGAITFAAPSWSASTGTDTNTQYAGQLVGFMENSSSVTGCFGTGSLTVRGYVVNAGGLVGYNKSSSIIQSYSGGSVTAEGKTLYIGGLAGASIYSGATVSNCYSMASVNSTGVTTSNIGSLIGYVYNNSTVKYSYATGLVTAAASADSTRVGFIGFGTGTLILTALYYDYETMGIGNPKDYVDTNKVVIDHDSIFDKTTALMKAQETYAGWNFTDIWSIDAAVNNGYPTLDSYLPRLSTPVNIFYDGANLRWDTVDDADLYAVTILADGVSNTYVSNTNSYTVPILAAGDYVASVMARREDGTFKDSTPAPTKTYHMGLGTEEDPIIIYSVDELLNIGTGATVSTLEGVTTITPKFYELSKDLNLNGAAIIPIGGSARFQGYFDGQDNTVSNYIINAISGEKYYGLFSGVLNGSVKNLDVTDYTINIATIGQHRIGGLAGYISNSLVDNCASDGSIIYTSAEWTTSDKNTQYAGQLIGYSDNLSNITDCNSTGSLTISGYAVNAGGLIGYSKNSVITKSFTSGTVSATGNILYVGGLTGESLYADSSIGNCYSLTNLTADGESTTYIGSLIGYLYDTVSVNYCYSVGNVLVSASEDITSCGFIGYATDTSALSSLYYNYEQTGLGNPKDTGNAADCASVYDKTHAQMIEQANYLNWNFTTIWTIDPAVNSGYPTLR